MNQKLRFVLVLLAILSTQLVINSTDAICSGFQWVKADELNFRSVRITDVSPTINGDFFVCGEKYMTSYHYSFLERYDSTGVKVASIGISPSYSGVLSVGSDSLGNFYFIVYVYNYYSSASFGGVSFGSPSGSTVWEYLVKSDKNGNYLWHKILSDGTYDLSHRLSVDPDGKFYLLSATSCVAFDSSGTQSWVNLSVGGGFIKSNPYCIYLSNSSSILRINKMTGSLLGSLNVHGLSSLISTSADEIYYSDSTGTHKLLGLSNIWSNPALPNAYLGVDDLNVWATTSSFDGANGRDSVYFWKGELNTGSFSIADTLIHLTHSFAGTASILCKSGSAPLLLLGVVGSSYHVYIAPPFLMNATYYSQSDLIMAKVNLIPQAALNFGSSFWNIYDGDLHWLGGKKCPGGSSFDLDYKFYNCSLQQGNIVIAEMSDASGSFANPYILGATSANGCVGKITCSIPSTVPDGNNYLIRFRSTNPTLTSVQNSFPVGIRTPVSTISLTGNSTFCAKSKPIVCSYTGGNYVWQRNGVNISNSNSYQFSPSLSGTYKCIVTETGYGANSCSRASSNTISVTTLPLPNASILPLTNSTVCNGDSVVLALSSPGSNSFLWYKYSNPISNANASSYSVKTTGTYKVIVTDANGCTKTSSSQKVTVLKPIIKALGATTFCAGGNVVLSVDTANVTSIQWFKNSQSIASQAGMYLIATQAAYYKALCTYRNGCSAYSNSIRVVVNCRLSENEFENVLVVYPNPASQQFTIEAEGLEETGNAFLQISNALGQVVYWRDLVVADGSLEEDVLIDSRIPAGVYMVKLTVNNTVYNSRLVIQ